MTLLAFQNERFLLELLTPSTKVGTDISCELKYLAVVSLPFTSQMGSRCNWIGFRSRARKSSSIKKPQICPLYRESFSQIGDIFDSGIRDPGNGIREADALELGKVTKDLTEGIFGSNRVG